MGARRSTFEPERDGCSVIIWLGKGGTRIVYYTDEMAENAAQWLIEKSREMQYAKDQNDKFILMDSNMVTISAFDSDVTEFELVQKFISRARTAGFDVQDDLTRSQLEYW